MSGNIDEKKIYGLHSFTNPQDAWEVMGYEWGGSDESIHLLDDRKFKVAVTEKIIISLGLAKIGKISYDDAREYLGIGVDMISHLTNFNFFLYSDKNKKFYTSISISDGDYYNGEIDAAEWYTVYKELHETYHFEELVAKGIEFVQTNLSLFDNSDKEEVMDELLEKFWNEPDL